jgi:isopentenyl-diphosphate delta-isomerase
MRLLQVDIMLNKEPKVILIDFKDREIGTMGKEQAHREGRLHRAFSVFLYQGQEILIQKRALGKYHCGGLWTNTCCSHPMPGEYVLKAAKRRLSEEAGINVDNLKELYNFFYYSTFSNGLTEFECDHVMVGEYDGSFHLNPEELEELRWISCNELEEKMLKSPADFTPWFLICAPEVIRYISKL